MATGVQIIEHDPRDLPSDMPSMATRMPEGGQIVSERTLFGDVVMAQPTRAPRNEGRIMQRIDASAGAAGASWYYRFPVKKRGGGIDYIEGPSIECADAVSRWYGNCQVAAAVQDIGTAWIIHSRFVDLETGYTLIRPFLQSKAGSRLGGDDDERRLQIALSIGVSKSQRNVVVHALRDFTDRAFAAAKRNLVERVGLKLPEYRKRCVDKLNELGPDLLARVERNMNRKADAWLAPDVSRLIAEIQTVADGMSSADEVWPREVPPEPRRSDAAPAAAAPIVQSPAAPAAAQESAPISQPAQPEGTAVQPAEAGTASASPDPGQPEGEDLLDNVEPPPPHDEEQEAAPPRTVSRWLLQGSPIGQDAVLDALRALLNQTRTIDEVDELCEVNADRIQKITGTKGSSWRMAVRDHQTKITNGRLG